MRFAVKKVFFKLALASGLLSTAFSVQAQTLSGAIRQAICFNPDVVYAVVNRHTTYEQYLEARADNLPSVDLNAAYGPEHSENPTATDVSGDNGTLPRREASIQLTQHIFAGFGITNEVNRTRETMKSSAYKLQGVANDIALDVTEQYLNVLRNQALLGVAQDNINQHQQILSMINQRTEAGVDREADLRQAQGRYALAKANLIATKSFLDDAKVRYTRLVGAAPNNLKTPRVPTSPVLPKTMKSAVCVAVSNHPTLKSALADVSAALAQHQASKATNYPHLDFVAAASRNRNLDGIKGDNNDASALLRVSYNVFKGGKDIATQRKTAYQVQEAQEVKNRTLLQVEETTRLAWDALVNTQMRLNFLQSHVAASLATLQAYKEQFKAGKRSLFDLLDAQNEYFNSKRDYVSAKYDELFARYRILNAMGKLIQYEHVALPAVAFQVPKDNPFDPIEQHHVDEIAR